MKNNIINSVKAQTFSIIDAISSEIYSANKKIQMYSDMQDYIEKIYENLEKFIFKGFNIILDDIEINNNEITIFVDDTQASEVDIIKLEEVIKEKDIFQGKYYNISGTIENKLLWITIVI